MSASLGISLQLAGCILTSLAYVSQKLAHKMSTTTTVYLRLPWLLGFLGLCVAAALNLWSYSMLPQVALASFGAATLVFNLLFSRLLLGEPLTRIDGLATLIISIGTITALSAVPSGPSPSLDDLSARLRAPSAAAYLALALGGGGAAAALVERAAAAAVGGAPPGALLLIGAPLLGGVAHSLVAFSAKGVAAALFGGGAAAALGRGAFWGFLFSVGGALAAQLRYLNVGLSVGGAVTIVPLFQSSVIVATAVAGVCLAGDMAGEPPAAQAQFAAGLIVIVGGVGSLAWKRGAAGEGKAPPAHGAGAGAEGAEQEFLPLVEGGAAAA
jgi:hypothetical protein